MCDKQSPFSRLRTNHPDYTWTEAETALMVKLLADKTVLSDGGEGATTYYIFVEGTTDEEILEILKLYGIYIGGTQCGCEHDCCGCWNDGPVTFQPNETEIRVAWQHSYRNV